MLLTEAMDARDRCVQRSGFSSQQRVFGRNNRMPASLLRDGPIDRQLLGEAHSDAM